MLYRVLLSDKAESDVESVLLWFRAKGAIRAGERWLDQLYERLDSLEKWPARCGLIEETLRFNEEIRQAFLGKRPNRYRIIFRIIGSKVMIARIFHGSRVISLEDIA